MTVWLILGHLCLSVALGRSVRASMKQFENQGPQSPSVGFLSTSGPHSAFFCFFLHSFSSLCMKTSGDMGLIPWPGRSSGEGNGHSSILAWEIPCREEATVHGVAKSGTQLSDSTATAVQCLAWSMFSVNLTFSPSLLLNISRMSEWLEHLGATLQDVLRKWSSQVKAGDWPLCTLLVRNEDWEARGRQIPVCVVLAKQEGRRWGTTFKRMTEPEDTT